MAMHSPRTVQYDSSGGTTSTSPTLARIAPPVLSSAYDYGTPRKMTRAFLRTNGVQRGLGIFSNMKPDGCFQNSYSASLCPYTHDASKITGSPVVESVPVVPLCTSIGMRMSHGPVDVPIIRRAAGQV
jgi:hypothetical protein